MEDSLFALSTRLRKFSETELAQKDAFLKRTIKTSNPQKFFKNLVSDVAKLGYLIDTEAQEKVARGMASRNVRMVSPLMGMRKRIRKPSRYNRTLLIGIGLVAAGLFLAIFSLYALLLSGLGELVILLWFSNRRAKKVPDAVEMTSKIWLFVESLPEAAANKLAPAETQHLVPSEFAVYAAWDSDDEKEQVQKECEQLATRLDSFI